MRGREACVAHPGGLMEATSQGALLSNGGSQFATDGSAPFWAITWAESLVLRAAGAERAHDEP
ncbi:MAG: hypothetical protein H6Q90_897 [Deltaproteobacteria bacterium]|nr:hypothetical protein [Deltaproteobacteria bacterium]